MPASVAYFLLLCVAVIDGLSLAEAATERDTSLLESDVFVGFPS